MQSVAELFALMLVVSNMPKVNIIWFRRDLRLDDNAALFHALKSGHPVVPVFIFDRNILNKLDNRKDPRVEFIHLALLNMEEQLLKLGSTLEVYDDTPVNAYKHLLGKYEIEKVFANNDYEPYATTRDTEVQQLLQASGAGLFTIKDHVIFEKNELVKDDGTPYTVYTPYAKKWRAKLTPFYLEPYPCHKYQDNFYKQPAQEIPSL